MNCVKPHTSFMEQFILIALRQILGDGKVLSRDTEAIGQELDIYSRIQACIRAGFLALS